MFVLTNKCYLNLESLNPIFPQDKYFLGDALAYIMALFSTSKTLSSTPPYTNPLFSIEPNSPLLTPCIPRTRPHHMAHFSTRKAPSPFISSLQPVYLSSSIISSTILAFESSPTQLIFASKLFAQPTTLPIESGALSKPPGKSSSYFQVL